MSKGPSQATLLVSAGKTATLWHTPEMEPWATITAYGHKEHWPLRSKPFRRWLTRMFYENQETSPNAQAVQDAMSVLEGEAIFNGAEHPVYGRVAEHDGAVYLDLADKGWRAIEIDTTGWRVISNPPVRFRRANGMLPLPEPTTGDISKLWRYLNIGESDRPLITAWLAATLRAHGPYPLLGFVGEQGGGKSTNAQVLRKLIDPNSAPLRSESRDVRDLMIAARNGWVIALDNLSRVPAWTSDALCRLATGGGFATRELFTDDGEIIFDAMRPVILTAIEDVINRGDLLDRAILLAPPLISEQDRMPEREFWAAFEQDCPAILGGLLDAVSAGLRNEPTVQLDSLPRMADFAIWGAATEPAFGWESGTFLATYENSRASANETALEASPVYPVIVELLNEHGGAWSGTSTDLLDDLNTTGDEGQRKRRERSKAWPKSARALGGMVRRLAPNLRAADIEVDFAREGKSRRRTIRLEKVRNEPSAPSAGGHFAYPDGESGADDMADGRDQANGNGPPSRPPDFPYPHGENAESEGMADGADGKSHLNSNGRGPRCRNCGLGLSSINTTGYCGRAWCREDTQIGVTE